MANLSIISALHCMLNSERLFPRKTRKTINYIVKSFIISISQRDEISQSSIRLFHPKILSFNHC